MINIFGLTIHIYGLLIGIGIYIAWEIANLVADEKKLVKGVIDRLAWWLIVPGVIGARLYHVVDYWSRYYSHNFLKVFYVWEGGLAIWGAVLGGFIGLLIYSIFSRRMNKNTRVNILDILDCVSVGLPLAQAIGRVGNWVNGELYGKNGEPLFAYEAVINLILFWILRKRSRKHPKRGSLIGVYLIGYGVIRAVLENLRDTNMIWKISGIPVATIFSLVSICLGLWLLSPKNKDN